MNLIMYINILKLFWLSPLFMILEKLIDSYEFVKKYKYK